MTEHAKWEDVKAKMMAKLTPEQKAEYDKALQESMADDDGMSFVGVEAAQTRIEALRVRPRITAWWDGSDGYARRRWLAKDGSTWIERMIPPLSNDEEITWERVSEDEK
jgi:hypothetical protein